MHDAMPLPCGDCRSRIQYSYLKIHKKAPVKNDQGFARSQVQPQLSVDSVS